MTRLPLLLLAAILAATAAAAPRRLDRHAVARVAHARDLTPKQVRALHRARGHSLEEIRRMPEAKLRKAVARAGRPKPAFPGDAFEYRLMTEVNSRGVLPPGVRPAALARRKALGLRATSRGKVAGVPVGAGSWLGRDLPGGGRWRWLGPGNIGGRTRALVIHPQKPEILWAGSAGGGAWKSVDGGATWHPLDDLLPSLAISSLVLDPRHPDVLYAATSEGFFRGRGVPGAGIFVSRDGGRSFEHLEGTSHPDFVFTNRLAFTADGETLLAATARGIRRSGDGGKTWTAPGEPVAGELLDVDCHPSDPGRCVTSGSDSDVHFTVDGGKTWARATGLPEITQPDGYQRVEVCYAGADPRIVYASVDTDGGKIYRSTDGGRHFHPRRTELKRAAPREPVRYLGFQGWYDNVIWADVPGDPDTVIVGGINLWRSRDGGDHLEEISYWHESPRSAHADHHVIVRRPGPPGERVVYFGNDGGVYRTDDVLAVKGLDGWQVKNTNYGVTQFYRAARSLLTGTLVGGTQDNGTLRYSPAQGVHNWVEFFGGDGGFCAWDPVNADVFYGEYIWLMIHRSLDHGGSAEFICGVHWDHLGFYWKEPPYRIEDVKNGHANFIAPFMLDPTDSDRLVGGAHGVWVSEDPRTPNTETSGPRWRMVKPGLDAPRERNFVSALGMAEDRRDELWVGHNKGEVFVSRSAFDEEPAWQRVDAPIMPRRAVLCVLPSPGEPGRVYVTYGGYDAGGVWTSPDDGESWMDLSAGLPDVPVRSILVHPENPRWLYVGTSIGVFVSDDRGATWWPGNRGPTTSPVDQLLWDRTHVGPASQRSLLAVTHGRGIYTLEMEK